MNLALEIPPADDDSPPTSGVYPSVRPLDPASDDMAVWESQRRSMKRRAWLVCMAFPMMIGAVLVSISGESRPKEPALRVLHDAAAAGETVEFNLKREAAELEEARAEIAAAQKAAPISSPLRGSGKTRR